VAVGLHIRRFRVGLSTLLILSAIIFYGYSAIRYRPTHQILTEKTLQIVSGTIRESFSAYSLPWYTETLLGNNQEPINVAIVVKDVQHVTNAMRKAGWYLADNLAPWSLGKLAKAVFLNSEYVTAPLTPSFWNEKMYDVGFEKPTDRETVRERHHVRLWRTGLVTKGGGVVYVGTVSFDKNIKGLLTHKMGENIDEERELLLADLRRTEVVQSAHKEQIVSPTAGINASGNTFITDGHMYVIWLK
jgi:undecaprenyl-diphosphatase